MRGVSFSGLWNRKKPSELKTLSIWGADGLTALVAGLLKLVGRLKEGPGAGDLS